jgi:hypothetical protein
MALAQAAGIRAGEEPGWESGAEIGVVDGED